MLQERSIYHSFWPSKSYFPRRLIIAILMSFGALNMSLQRSLLSTTMTGSDGMGAEFHWSNSEKGIIFSSFFWGYTASQIFIGYFMLKFGSRYIFGIGNLLTTLFNALALYVSPMYGFFIFTRVCMGLAGGVYAPTLAQITAAWYPPDERDRAMSLFLNANKLGNLIGILVPAFIMESLGWRGAFYFYFIFGLFTSILWLIFVKDSPHSYSSIHIEEVSYITQTYKSHTQPLLLHSASSIQSNPLPISSTYYINNQKISSSSSLNPSSTATSASLRAMIALPIFIIYVCFIGTTFGYYTLLTYVPQYFHTILGLKLTSAAIYQIVPSIGSILVQQFGAYSIEYLSGRYGGRTPYLSMKCSRKLIFILGYVPHAIFLAAMGYVDYNLAIIFYTLGVIIGGYSYPVVYTNIAEIAPYHASQIMSIANTIGAITAIVCPILGGFLLDGGNCIEDGSQNDDHYNEPYSCIQAWQILFWVVCILELLACVIFTLFSTDQIIIDIHGNRITSQKEIVNPKVIHSNEEVDPDAELPS